MNYHLMKLQILKIKEEKNDNEENYDSVKYNDETKNQQDYIDLMFNLDKNIIKNDDIFTYDINSINKLNSGLFESFLFSSNQSIGECDRLVFVEEFLTLTLKKNEECPEEEEDNR